MEQGRRESHRRDGYPQFAAGRKYVSISGALSAESAEMALFIALVRYLFAVQCQLKSHLAALVSKASAGDQPSRILLAGTRRPARLAREIENRHIVKIVQYLRQFGHRKRG